MRTGRISHASAHSCEGQASATTAHRLHEENLYDRQPTERKHEEKKEKEELMRITTLYNNTEGKIIS